MFSLVIYFIHGINSVYVSIPISQMLNVLDTLILANVVQYLNVSLEESQCVILKKCLGTALVA